MDSWKNYKTLPDVLNAEVGQDFAILTLNLEPELFHFQGHFPNNPILPGVSQLDLAVQFATSYLNITASVREVTKLKFRSLLRPMANAKLKLEYNPIKHCVNFQFLEDKIASSSGTVHFAST